MKTETKWGDRYKVHRYDHTPFGEVELYDFEKTGMDTFTLWLRIYSDMAEKHTMDVLWRNCDAIDAMAYFGIHPSEQRMERTQ
jgi:hypothetical protein